MTDLTFELTENSKTNAWGVTVWQIRALVDIPRHGVRKGDLGGWVESARLSNGDARVFGDAWVFGDAQVFGAAQVSGDAWVFGDAQVFGDAWVFGDAQVGKIWQVLVVGPIGSENVTATIYRTKNGKHRLRVGCWEGTLGTLMAEVKRRRDSWAADDAQQELWMSQYKALKALGRATVARWEVKS